MTDATPRRAGWAVWILFILGILAVPLDMILVIIAGAIALNGSSGSSLDGSIINAGCMLVLILGIGLVAALVMRRRRLVMAVSGVLLAPVVLIGVAFAIGLVG